MAVRKRKVATIIPKHVPPEAEIDQSPPFELPGDVRYQRVYYVYGPVPNHLTARYFIKDPPNSGYSRAFVLGADDAKRVTVFCPFTLQSYQVPPNAGEIAEATPEELTSDSVARLIGIVTKKWHDYVRMGFQRDYDVAALVLTKLGAEVPKVSLTDIQEETMPGARRIPERKERHGGKPCAKELTRPVARKSKRGQVAEFFLGAEQKSVRECMARLSMSRNSVLSALNILNKDHGLGYEVVNDTASIITPPDWDIWS